MIKKFGKVIVTEDEAGHYAFLCTDFTFNGDTLIEAKRNVLNALSSGISEELDKLDKLSTPSLTEKQKVLLGHEFCYSVEGIYKMVPDTGNGRFYHLYEVYSGGELSTCPKYYGPYEKVTSFEAPMQHLTATLCLVADLDGDTILVADWEG